MNGKTDRQLEPLFDQIEPKASEILQNNKVAFPHYMGSLLVIPEGEASRGSRTITSLRTIPSRAGGTRVVLCVPGANAMTSNTVPTQKILLWTTKKNR
jgi:hypothetical protein